MLNPGNNLPRLLELVLVGIGLSGGQIPVSVDGLDAFAHRNSTTVVFVLVAPIDGGT